MAIVYFTYSSDYSTLRISGSHQPSGRYTGSFDSADDPTQGGAIQWKGYFDPHAKQIKNVVIEDEVILDYANNLFDGLVNCTQISGIDKLRGNLLNTTRMFANTPKLTQEIRLANLMSINCLDATEMFAGCGSSSIVLDNINMKNCTSTKGMFKNAAAKTIEMTSINTQSVRDSSEMFAGCSNLTNIYGTGGYFDFAQVINSTNMFNGTPLLTNYPNKGYDKAGAISIDEGGYINMSPNAIEMVDVRIQLKYDTKANWLAYDPVPLAGEMCIESDTNRFKVGDGAHTYSQLPYMYGFRIDDLTIKEDSETTELFVPIDNDTIFIGADGKIRSREQLHADGVTIMQSPEGELFLELDNTTVRVNDAGQIESLVEIDDRTVKRGASGLYVPIDNDTLFVQGGVIKAKGDLTPGRALEWNATNPRTLDVKIDNHTITTTNDGPTGVLSVSYDGDTIHWEGTGDNGALTAWKSVAGDGIDITNDQVEGKQTLSVKVDDDTIKIQGGKLVATAQVPEVDGESIILSEGKLSVNADGETIFIEDGKLKAKGYEPDETTIILSEGKLTAVKQMPDIDNITIIVSEGKLTAVSQAPEVDNKTIVLDGDGKLSANIDNETIIYSSEDNWLEVPYHILETENGIYARETSEGLAIGVNVDNKTIFINEDGELEGAPNVLVDDKTITIDSENVISVNIDNETIVYNEEADWIEVPHQTVEFTDGLYTIEHSEGITVGVNVDNKTIFVNSQGQLEGAPNVLVDNRTIVIDSENVISVPIDEETIVYDEDNKWIEVNYKTFSPENGLYMREDSENIFIGALVDDKTIFVNSEGKLEGAPNVIADEKTIIHNSAGEIEVHYDHDTIIYDDSEGLKVDGIEIVPISPVYIKENSEFGIYMIGCGYDNTTITLNEKNELQTAVGGGWRYDPEEKIIATGTNVQKIRHHMLPDDDADYFLETVWFPNPLVEKSPIQAKVTHDAAFMDETVELKYIKEWDVWYYDGRYWTSEGIAPDHPLNPHGYSIYVQRNKTVVQLHEDFETDPDTLTCTIKYGGHNVTKEYIDNQFIKVDDETIYVNSEGELAARLQLKAGKWIQISEGTVSMGNLCQGLGYNEESDCIYVKDATSEEVGGIKIDGVTLKYNNGGQLEFDMEGLTDRGVDASTGKIGHTNVFEGPSRQAGDPTSIPSIKWDDYGHLTSVESKDIPTYLGASAYSDGVRGLVPEASSSKRKAFLRGDGTWSNLFEANLFSVIETEATWWVGTDRRSKVIAASPNANQLVIAPLGFVVDRDTEGIDTIYMTEANLGSITVCARSNSQGEIVVKGKAQWLCLNL